jgi:hypothetical protein
MVFQLAVHKVRPMFEQRALPVCEDVMLKWRLMVDAEADFGKGDDADEEPFERLGRDKGEDVVIRFWPPQFGCGPSLRARRTSSLRCVSAS